jgi:hypothetical protein
VTAAGDGDGRHRAGPGLERLLPIACLGGALLLIVSEFMTTFRFEAAGETVLKLSEGSDRHAWAMLILGVFAIVSLVIAVRNGSKPAAVAVAAAGVTAVLLFLIIDLPDAGKVGTFDDDDQTFIQAETHPEGGFWLELIGALVLAVCGAALATLSGDQLRGLAGRFAGAAALGGPRGATAGEDHGSGAGQVDGATPDLAASSPGREKRAIGGKQAERRRERT